MTTSDLRYTVDMRPDADALRALWLAAWSSPGYDDWNSVLTRSFCFVCAYDGDQLVGFVNVAWDGGVHASLFDTSVHPTHQRRGVGTALVRHAAAEAARRGADWLHVDFEPHFTRFYRGCGFRDTAAGLLRLRAPLDGEAVLPTMAKPLLTLHDQPIARPVKPLADSDVHVRPASEAKDRDALAQLDTSFITDSCYAVISTSEAFTLNEIVVDPPRQKEYSISWEDLRSATIAVVAERGGRVAGVAAMTLQQWNRRAEVTHLYVDREARGRGVGTKLMKELRREGERLGARCLWVETQNVNALAIRFYRRQGFVWCGLDRALYDAKQTNDEVALFFTLPLATREIEGTEATSLKQ